MLYNFWRMLYASKSIFFSNWDVRLYEEIQFVEDGQVKYWKGI